MYYHVKVRKTKDRGRGVYALKKFSKSEIIEKCPVLEFPVTDAKIAQNTFLKNYLYDWNGRHKSCLPLGYGLFYNHSYHPNARYIFDHNRKFIIYKAIKIIHPGQEITVNYNFNPRDKSPTDVSDIPPHPKFKLVS